MNRRHRLALGSVSLIIGAGVGYAIRAHAAGIPATGALAYAGVLEDTNGPVNGPHNVQVVMYDSQAETNNLCQSPSSNNSITIVDGHFSVPLPDTCAAAVGANSSAWVDVLIDGQPTGSAPIHAVPYAVEANHAVNATNATNASNALGGSALSNDLVGLASSVATLDDAFNVQATANSAAKLWTQSHANGISFDWEQVAQFSVWVDGAKQMSWTSNGATKTFVIDHPTDSDRYLVHATLEGPENAVYYRGSAHLHHGVAEVSLPSYFEAATVSAGRTVLATPTFDTADEPVSGLAVSHVKNGAFVVRGVDKSNPEQAFDWEVKAVRADSPALVTEPKRADVALHGDGPYRYLTTRTATTSRVP